MESGSAQAFDREGDRGAATTVAAQPLAQLALQRLVAIARANSPLTCHRPPTTCEDPS